MVAIQNSKGDGPPSMQLQHRAPFSLQNNLWRVFMGSGMNRETHHLQLNTKILPLPLEATEPQTAVGWESLCTFSKNRTKILISGYLSFWQLLQKPQIHSVRNLEDKMYQATRDNFSCIWLLFSATVKPSRNSIIVSVYYKCRFFQTYKSLQTVFSIPLASPTSFSAR